MASHLKKLNQKGIGGLEPIREENLYYNKDPEPLFNKTGGSTLIEDPEP